MISKTHRRSLTRFEGKIGALIYWLALLGPIILLIFGGINLWLASRIGSAGGYALGDFINIWLDEIDVTKEYSYSGVFLAGLHRFNSALLHLSFAIVLLPLAFGTVFIRNRDREIIKALRKHGEI